MKIVHVESGCYRIPLPRPLSDATHGIQTDFQLITVRLRDDRGLEGVGYTYTVGQGGLAVQSLIEHDLAPAITGVDLEIGDAWQRMWRRLHYVGRGGPASFAISAIDIGLWDLLARQQALPLWRLLGGSSPEVNAYAGGIDLDFPLDDLLAQAETFRQQGFRAIKMKVGRPNLDEDVARVRAMRELLGAEFPLMIDANMAWSVEQAIDAAARMAELDLYWLEEPTEPDDFARHARIANERSTPIAAGENLHTLREFELMIDSGGVAFPEPDVSNIGGISAWLQVAQCARAAGLPVTSHGVQDLHVHLLAAVPNASLLEIHGFGLQDYTAHSLVIQDGIAQAPERAGHGVEFLWDVLADKQE